MQKLSVLLLAGSLTLLTACAGRKPVLVEKINDQDYKMDCVMLKAEIDECETIIIDKYHNGKNTMSNTIGAAVVGYVLFPPAFFLMDLKVADYKEMDSYRERRKHLIELGKENSCEWCKDEESDDELMALADKEHQVRKKKEAEEREAEEKDD